MDRKKCCEEAEKRIRTIEQFAERLCEEMNAREKEGKKFYIVVYGEDAYTGEKNYGICADLNAYGISPGIKILALWKIFQVNKDMDGIIERIQKKYQGLWKQFREQAPWIFDDMDEVRKHIGFRLVKAGTAEDYTGHISYLGMEVIFELHTEPRGQFAYALNRVELENILKNEDLDAFCMLVRENMARMYLAHVASLEEIKSEEGLKFYPIESEEGRALLRSRKGEYILRDPNETYGAGILLYPGMAEQIAELLGNSFYFLLLLATETMIIPSKLEDPEMECAVLAEMTAQINKNMTLPEEDRLSQDLFYYDREKKEFAVTKIEV